MINLLFFILNAQRVYSTYASPTAGVGSAQLIKGANSATVGMDAEGSGMGGVRLPLDRAALSVALGRDNVVHLALAERASAERVALPLRRLLHFTGAIDSAADDIGERTDATA